MRHRGLLDISGHFAPSPKAWKVKRGKLKVWDQVLEAQEGVVLLDGPATEDADVRFTFMNQLGTA